MAEPVGPTSAVAPVQVSGSKGRTSDGTEYPVVDYRGADSDKSSIIGMTAGSTYFAWDSSKFYMYDGTQWKELFGSGS